MPHAKCRGKNDSPPATKEASVQEAIAIAREVQSLSARFDMLVGTVPEPDQDGSLEREVGRAFHTLLEPMWGIVRHYTGIVDDHAKLKASPAQIQQAGPGLEARAKETLRLAQLADNLQYHVQTLNDEAPEEEDGYTELSKANDLLNEASDQIWIVARRYALFAGPESPLLAADQIPAAAKANEGEPRTDSAAANVGTAGREFHLELAELMPAGWSDPVPRDTHRFTIYEDAGNQKRGWLIATVTINPAIAAESAQRIGWMFSYTADLWRQLRKVAADLSDDLDTQDMFHESWVLLKDSAGRTPYEPPQIDESEEDLLRLRMHPDFVEGKGIVERADEADEATQEKERRWMKAQSAAVMAEAKAADLSPAAATSDDGKRPR